MVCGVNSLPVKRLTLALIASVLPLFADGNSIIAGLEPSQRPVDGPMITTVILDHDWYARALHGIQPPYRASFRFLEDQGNWFTPFNHPGMTGRYDIRNWHGE